MIHPTTRTFKTPHEAADFFAAKLLSEGYQHQALHVYTDAEGHPLYWRIRLKHPDGRKWIRPLYEETRGQYQLGEPAYLKKGLKPLYGLALINRYPDAVVFCVEGEYCADQLNAFFEQQNQCKDFIAVTSGSVSSAMAADWQPLAKRSCIIWPDADVAGETYGEAVEAALLLQGCTVQWIDPCELHLEEKEDCVDWLKKTPTATVGDIVHRVKAQHKKDKDEEKENKSAIASSEENALITHLATLSPLEYDRIRLSAAKELHIRPLALDQLMKSMKAAKKDIESPFPTIEPWPEPIEVETLLSEITDTIHRFIICSRETAHAATLWVVMTWVIDVISVAPLAVITAPEKRCGKSQLLFLLGHLVNRSLTASNITPAALFRVIDAWKPTLLIDEMDTFLSQNDELRGLLNCGHTRNSAYTIRTEGEDLMPKKFSVWGAKALAGIHYLPDTLMDRAITLALRRKLPEEKVERLRDVEEGLFETLRAKLARFQQDYATVIQTARPALPPALNDRAQDNWEALLAIADLGGDAWSRQARHAATCLSGKDSALPSVGVELLVDIQELFETHRVDRFSSVEFIRALCADEEKPWATYNRGLPIKPRQLAVQLREFGIVSHTIRMGSNTGKGYLLSQFADAFARYVPVAETNAEGLPSLVSHSLWQRVIL